MVAAFAFGVADVVGLEHDAGVPIAGMPELIEDPQVPRRGGRREDGQMEVVVDLPDLLGVVVGLAVGVQQRVQLGQIRIRQQVRRTRAQLGFDGPPEPEDAAQLVDVEWVDDRAPPGAQQHQTLSIQAAQRFPHRNGAHSELLGQVDDRERGPGGERAVEDGTPHLGGHHVHRRTATRSRPAIGRRRPLRQAAWSPPVWSWALRHVGVLVATLDRDRIFHKGRDPRCPAALGGLRGSPPRHPVIIEDPQQRWRAVRPRPAAEQPLTRVEEIYTIRG